MNKRRLCSFCAKELAPTAFFRHLNDKFEAVCLGKRRRIESSEDYINSPKTLDSSFELLEDSNHENESPQESGADISLLHSDYNSVVEITDSESLSTVTANSDVEVWDNTESDDEKETENNSSQVRDVLSAISLFLVFYHLFYHISENAVNTIIGFIRALSHFA